jgi:hypothetical protein
VDYLKRLAFWTIRAEEAAKASELFHLTGSKAEDIDLVMTVDEADVDRQQQALDCYVTYRETIEKAGARRNIPPEAVFELYQEAHNPPLTSLLEGLVDNGLCELVCSDPKSMLPLQHCSYVWSREANGSLRLRAFEPTGRKNDPSVPALPHAYRPKPDLAKRVPRGNSSSLD